MKKYVLVILIFITIFMTGCGKVDKEKLMNSFVNTTNDLKSYYMEGILSISNNDDVYNYDVKVSYNNPDYFKVSLLNKANNYEQIILRNTNGIYVINPSLNKSFRFQSEWPYNNSQSYLLQSVANDLKNDKEYNYSEKNDCYIYNVKANYPNNAEFVRENICLTKDASLKYVEVLDENEVPRIKFEVKSIDKKPVFKDDYFEIDSIITENDVTNDSNKEDKNQQSETTGKIEDALFPLYLPTNTSLSSKETIDTNFGQRVIMTFSGDNSFILVQETVGREEEFTIIPSYGEPYLLIDTVGALTNTSYTWISNGVEYYIVSDVLSINELLEVAKSINVIATIKEK